LAAGGAGLLVAVAAVVGVWLLDQGVPLHVDAPPLGAEWLPHVGPGTAPAVVIALLVVMRGPELAGQVDLAALARGVGGYRGGLDDGFGLGRWVAAWGG
jgi:hypothetical protein